MFLTATKISPSPFVSIEKTFIKIFCEPKDTFAMFISGLSTYPINAMSITFFSLSTSKVLSISSYFASI